MRDQLEGSSAVATTVARCRPRVVCAYPITPQTHIVEALGSLVRTGALADCRFLNVESEFAALSVLVGASVAGSRAYTATASQGLLYMAEVVHNAAGLELPLVMTVANRAVGAPINIWNDHSDAMAVRDAGWLQLYAADNQEAVDLHLLAFRLAEVLSLPVMVCVDGFVLTHAVEEVDVPDQAVVDRWLPPFATRQRLDLAHPRTIGAMVGPEAFTEVRYLADRRLRAALEVLPALGTELGGALGRPGPDLLRPYRTDGARCVVVAQGAVFGTLMDVVDGLRQAGEAVGAAAVTCFRPFPDEALRTLLAGVDRVVVVDRALAPGRGGVLATEVRPLLAPGTPCVDLVAGLGGRPVTRTALRSCLLDALDDLLPPVHFVELRTQLLSEELDEISTASGGRP